MKVIGMILVAVVLALAVWAGAAWYSHRNNGDFTYRTAEVKRGDLSALISATGTVEPEELVDVGAQVAARIISFGKDVKGKSIDYRSDVEQGMVLAQLDPSLYQTDVASAQAQLSQARSGVLRAQADLGQLQAHLIQAERDWNRAKKLGPGDALAQADYDAAESAYEVAKANVSVGEASVKQAEQAVGQAQATLSRAQQNLGYCTIISPVKGTVIDRRVNIGQTVVSSLSAPSLFLLAKDLRRMQVWASVNEADIGKIHEGQDVSFTVDAFPGETFKGAVSKVRFNATMTQNVVTYTVEITTDNSNMRLLPYLTANVNFQVDKRENVLLVPNVALRWMPASQDQVSPDARLAEKPGPGGGGNGGAGAGGAGANAGGRSRGGDGNGGTSTRPHQQTGAERTRGTLWVLDCNFVKPVKVRVGMTDGTNTEILSDTIKEGTEVVTGESAKSSGGSDDARNPFMPQFPGRRSGGR